MCRGETHTVVTVVPCLCFLQRLHKAHSRGTAPYMHHNALYRWMLVTFFFRTKSDHSTVLAVTDGEVKINMALVLIRKS